MAGLTRKTSVQFGAQGPETDFAQFGSKVALNPQFSQDPTVIQQLPAWAQGWQNAVVSGDYAAYLEDMNGFCFVDSYQITYLFQMGIPEWDSATLYFTGSVVQIASSGQWFRSLQGGVPGSGGGQSGNAPPASASNAFWQWLNNPAVAQDGGLTAQAIPKVSITGPATLVDSGLSDNGTNVILSEPLQFPDGSVQSKAATSVVSNQANLGPTGSNTRSLGTNYQNTGSKPMFVSVTGQGGSNGIGIQAFTDSNSNPTTAVAEQYQNGSGVSGSAHLFFIVLPGNYYRVNNVFSASLQTWIEWS